MPEQIFDKGYKRILSKKKNFLSLLKNFIHAAWINDLTEEDLELINSEFIPKDFKEKESDLIYKTKIKGKEVIFYFLFELQSSVDFTICFRLLAYMFELYKRLFLDAEEKIRERADFKLPAIVPCVLFNGNNTWTAVKSFKEYLNGHELFGENVVDFKYILLNVNKYSDETLLEIGDLISSVFALDKKQDVNNFKSTLEKISKIFMNLSADEQIDLTDWIKDVLMKKVKDSKKDFIDTIINNFKKGDANDMTYAIERMLDEIETKGKAEGELKVINLIRKKVNKSLQAYQIADILELDFAYIQEVVSLINEYPSLSDKEIALKLIQQENQW